MLEFGANVIWREKRGKKKKRKKSINIFESNFFKLVYLYASTSMDIGIFPYLLAHAKKLHWSKAIQMHTVLKQHKEMIHSFDGMMQ